MMKLEEIQSLWEVDSRIDKNKLDSESLKLSELHNRYYKIYIQERFQLLKLDTDYKELLRLKYEYYDGTLDLDTIKEKGWNPNQKIILKANLQMYIESDKDIINITLRIGYQKEKIGFLESIIKNIQNRGFSIKNSIEFMKIQNGGY